MLYIVLVMVVVVVIAAAVVVYAAYPHRGEEVPTAPWLGKAMTRAVGRLPTITQEEGDQHREDQRG